uniref:DUF247 domain protein n=1 Tax=Salix viminalis TaxID=40686 RepID=A0A6N2LBB3_SALVM
MRTSDFLHIFDFRLSEIVARLLLTRVLKYSAVMLLKAGVRFDEASKDKCLVNITFDKGVLKIPRLEVDHNFERRIRNIMALEQCCYSSEAYICSYIKFMDHLIDSAEDVGLLVRKGIIVHTLGDDAAVSNMINNLCENIGDNINTRFIGISHRLNDHYENRSNHRKATLKLVYFPNVWRGTATVAAAILLILTFIQAKFPCYRKLRLEKDKFTARASNMKKHVEQASSSNMEDNESTSPKKGKGFDVAGSDSDIDYKDINNAYTTNTERDDKLSASSKGKDIAITSSISNPELKIEMTSKITEQLIVKINRHATWISFLDLVTDAFGKNTGGSFLNHVTYSQNEQSVNGSKHFSNLVSHLMLKGSIKRSYSFDPVKLKYSVVMLCKAGVRFQVTRDSCLVNVTFDKGVLKIPQLEVDHNFERLVRNIMAMEQCLYAGEAYICSYIKFMDHLIDSAGDVGLLVEKGIILHWLGDDAAVSNMINNFCENIGNNYTCFGDISRELNAHYENRWNHRKATLKLVYFPNIWRGTATVAAAILLILTFIQTLSSVKSFY